MFKGLFDALLGFFGLITKKVEFVKTQYSDFVKSLTAACFVLTRDVTPDGVQRSISSKSDSIWQHVVIYIGKTWGDRIRKKYPWLLQNPKIPKDAIQHEIIEAIEEGVAVKSLDRYNHDDAQMESWARPMTEYEIEQILLQAYLMVGGPYDYQGIAHHLLPFIPNPKDKYYCNEVVYYSYKKGCGEELKRKHVKEDIMTPRHLRDYCVLMPNWSRANFNMR